MLRIFTFIIACCLVYLTVTSLMESKNNENTIAKVSTVSNPADPDKTGGDGSDSIPVPLPPRIDDETTVNTAVETQSKGSNQQVAGRSEKDNQLEKELEELARQFENDGPTPQALDGDSLTPDEGPRYSKEEAWQYTAQAEKDLAQLENLLKN